MAAIHAFVASLIDGREVQAHRVLADFSRSAGDIDRQEQLSGVDGRGERRAMLFLDAVEPAAVAVEGPAASARGAATGSGVSAVIDPRASCDRDADLRLIDGAR